jgi:hypothetical protein
MPPKRGVAVLQLAVSARFEQKYAQEGWRTQTSENARSARMELAPFFYDM